MSRELDPIALASVILSLVACTSPSEEGTPVPEPDAEVFEDVHDAGRDVEVEGPALPCDPVVDFRRSAGVTFYECGHDTIESPEWTECSNEGVSCLDIHWQWCVPAHLNQHWSHIDTADDIDFFIIPDGNKCILIKFIDDRQYWESPGAVRRGISSAVDFGENLDCRNWIRGDEAIGFEELGTCSRGYGHCPTCQEASLAAVPCDDALDCPGTSVCTESGRECECQAEAPGDPWCQPSGLRCATDVDCGEHGRCQDGACFCRDDSACPGGKVCNAEGRCVLCATDADCPPEQRCDGDFDICVAR